MLLLLPLPCGWGRRSVLLVVEASKGGALRRAGFGVGVGGGKSSRGTLTHRRGGEKQSKSLRACSSPPFEGGTDGRTDGRTEGHDRQLHGEGGRSTKAYINRGRERGTEVRGKKMLDSPGGKNESTCRRGEGGGPAIDPGSELLLAGSARVVRG